MFTIPRLAIVAGLLIFPEGPLCLDRGELSDMFRPFRSLLLKIRELLWTLSRPELSALERALCSLEEPNLEASELMSTDCKTTPEPPGDVTHDTGYLNDSEESTIRKDEVATEFGVPNTSVNGQHGILDYLDQFYKDFPDCKQFISELVCHTTDRESPPSSVQSASEVDLSDSLTGSRRHLDIHLLANAMAVAHANVASLQNSTCSQDLECISGNTPTVINDCPDSCHKEDPPTRIATCAEEGRSSQNLVPVEEEDSKTSDREYEDNICDDANIPTNNSSSEDGRPERPRELICGDGGKPLAFSSYEDEMTPVAEIRVESLVETPHCSKLHSSGSSQDSGLSSMADGEKLSSPSVASNHELKAHSVAGSSSFIGSSKSLDQSYACGVDISDNSLRPQSSKHRMARTPCDSSIASET